MWCNVGFANNIRDFEIEGLSLDDNPSKLKNFSEHYYTEEISKNLRDNKTIYFTIIPKEQLSVYDEIHVHLDGKSYEKIAAVTALIYTENIQKCMNIKKEIEMSLISEFKGAIMSDDDYKKIKLDKSGRSRFISTKFSVASVCLLKITSSKAFFNFLSMSSYRVSWPGLTIPISIPLLRAW